MFLFRTPNSKAKSSKPKKPTKKSIKKIQKAHKQQSCSMNTRNERFPARQKVHITGSKLFNKQTVRNLSIEVPTFNSESLKVIYDGEEGVLPSHPVGTDAVRAFAQFSGQSFKKSPITAFNGGKNMSDWNPSLYLQYDAERTRPAAELLNRVLLDNARSVVDLGCGPGNSTALLRQRWPSANITGIDTSPAMLDEARKLLPDCEFIEADISTFQSKQPLDLIYANASLQWVTDHDKVIPHLVSLLQSKGYLAVQMPDNWLEPSHVLMRQVAQEQGHPNRGREPLPNIHTYYDILTNAGCDVDIWRTTYYHKMKSHQAIIDWVSSTGLRPWLKDLGKDDQDKFLTRYHELLEENYPLQEDGQILLPFPRLFIVGQRQD